MTTTTEKITPQHVLELARRLPPADQRWLVDVLGQDLGDTLPEHATVDEAIELYLADRCSLGRAAELAGITRWDLQDVLKERGIPIDAGNDLTTDQMDDTIDQLRHEGYLRPHHQ